MIASTLQFKKVTANGFQKFSKNSDSLLTSTKYSKDKRIKTVRTLGSLVDHSPYLGYQTE